MNKLNALLHQELRLTIVSYMVNVGKADFKSLLEVTSATKGNLSVQLSKLESAKYLSIKKSFKGKYPHTEYKITKFGITKYEEYLVEIKKMLNIK